MDERVRQRPNLGEMLRQQLRERIVRGELVAAQRINEVRLAEELGVSRTPLREALTALVAENLAVVEARRGFFVAPLDPAELEDLYGIRAILDPEALRAAGLPDAERISDLRRLNDRMRLGGDADELVALDDEWHHKLIERCPNRVLLGLIDHAMQLTRRYEQAYFRDGRSVGVATSAHETILEHLESGRLDEACAALRANMTSAVEPLCAWLAARNAP